MIKKTILTITAILSIFFSCQCLEPDLELVISRYITARSIGNVEKILMMYDQESLKVKYSDLFKENGEKIALEKAKKLFQDEIIMEYKERGGLPPKIFLEWIDNEGPVAYVNLLIKWDIKKKSESGNELEINEFLIFIKDNNEWKITMDLDKTNRILRESWNCDYELTLKELGKSLKREYTNGEIINFTRRFFTKSVLFGYEGIKEFLPQDIFIPNDNKFKKYSLNKWVTEEWLSNLERPIFLDESVLDKAEILRQSFGVFDMKTFLSGETLKELLNKKVKIVVVTIYEPRPRKEVASDFDIGMWEATKDFSYIKIFLLPTKEGLKFIGYYIPMVE